MNPNASDEEHKPVIIISSPRTRSNLLAQVLSTHPLIESIMYPLTPAFWGGPESPLPDESVFTPREKSELNTYQNCYDLMQERIQEIHRSGRIPMCKSHGFHILSAPLMNNYFPGLFKETHPIVMDRKSDSNPTSSIENPTVLPDCFMANITPIIMIRHPTRMVDSNAKGALGIMGANISDPYLSSSCALKWARILFDYYRGLSAGHAPIVIDGDKLVNDTEKLMVKLCPLIGIDSSQIRYEWEVNASCSMYTDAGLKQHPYLKELHESTGVIKDKATGLPLLEDKVREWTEEWDDDVAQKLKGFVEEAMNDYMYLVQFHL